MIGDTAITVVDPVPRMWLDSLAHESEFSYAPTFRPMSWWDRFWHWVQSLLSSSDGTNTTVDTGLWVVLAVLIVVLIFFLLRGARRSLKHRNLAVRGEAIDVDDIATEDINGKIEAEIAAKRWRSAIRYLYLRTLQDLQDVEALNGSETKPIATTCVRLHHQRCNRCSQRRFVFSSVRGMAMNVLTKNRSDVHFLYTTLCANPYAQRHETPT